MTAHRLDTHAIVVGAGPVGLMLAGELRLGGADTVVLDKLPSPTTESRASTLHARTMEILETRNLLAPLGDLPNEPMGHFGGIPLDLSLPSRYPGQWKVPQTRVEELLAHRATSLGADLRRGHELTALTVTTDAVEAQIRLTDGRTTRLRAKCVVGCDGENSTVRHLGGFAFPGTDARRHLLRADIDGIDIPGRRFERLPHGLAIAARRPDGVTRVMVHEYGARPRTAPPGFTEVTDAWKRVTGEDISGGRPLWVNTFGDASRHAARYRDHRLLLAGDAAHQQMPIGGQALNLGLQDAANLGWKLAAQLTGRGPDGLLDSYHSERHAVGRRVLDNIRAQALLLLGTTEADPARQVLAELLRHEDARRHLAGMISGLDTRYDVGPGTHPLLGARLPHQELTTRTPGPATAAELMHDGRGVLLLPPGDTAHHHTLRTAALPWKGLVHTATTAPPTGPAAPEPGAAGPGAPALLVRPDGHVAWAGEDPTGLTTALHRWFGTAAAPAAPPTTQTSPPRPLTPVKSPATPPRKKRSTDMGRLSAKTALVTGASRGMGRATALRLAQEGALVAVHYASNEEAAADVLERIEKDGGRGFTVRAELGPAGDVHELFLGLENGLRERTGSTGLDILVNNAGVMGNVKPQDTTPEAFDRIFAVNAKAPFFLIQRALKNMPDGGRIINISTGLTRFANPDEIAYAMSKGAVEQLALHYAKLLGPRGITINSVAPGITRNDNPVFAIPEAVEQMAQLSTFNRVGEPGDVADVVAFLATDEARWITGSFVDATGGTLLG
ncbi:SDR family oxidoreductase [Streptomyces cyaneofuscatus]|uniref:SDR family oxidoreductase n=1 Tax=Streptomyces cyaneofuscatus TaxID=66883 RepID=UPI00365AE56A